MAGKTLATGRVAETGHCRVAGFPTAERWLAAVVEVIITNGVGVAEVTTWAEERPRPWPRPCSS
ncbi:MAG: hypothetical protein KY439_11290 [Actinobacteria bacterium]|nr:hypothetical protein [Actinomycetota bacterium]